MAISISFHSGTLMGKALAWYAANEVDFDKVKATRDIENYPAPGEWVTLNKQKVDTINHLESKTNIPTATVKGETPSDNYQGPNSPSEKERSLF